VLKLTDLAGRADFDAGPLHISPGRRQVEGPAGRMSLEPVVMKVFLLLLESPGQVVTRDELFASVWGGVFVGDDSLNRAITQVRKIASKTAPGSFAIEVIPRTGYRMTGDAPDRLDRPLEARITELVERGRQLIRAAIPRGDEEAAVALREAVRLDASDAAAWGWLALALRNSVEEADPGDISDRVMELEAAARRALAIDPCEPNARLALATIRPEFGHWGATEDALREILADAPDHLPTLSYLLMVLQAVGRVDESWVMNERVIALDPLSPVPLFRRALKLWVFGRVSEADLTVDRALQNWPHHPAVWNARLLIFAFTGRAQAALDLVNDDNSRPASFGGKALQYWRTSLEALERPSPQHVEAAVRANFEFAPTTPYFAGSAMMVLSALGRIDDAYAVAEGTLLRRGPLIGTIWAGKMSTAVTDLQWRRTMPLFTPAAAAMRADPRFISLCDGMGMTAYWRSRGIGPDPMFGIELG
jgi:DNA-binding winged helix-turn-helix (wHTH) protein